MRPGEASSWASLVSRSRSRPANSKAVARGSPRAKASPIPLDAPVIKADRNAIKFSPRRLNLIRQSGAVAIHGGLWHVTMTLLAPPDLMDIQMSEFRTLDDLDFRGKKTIVRLDLN